MPKFCVLRQYIALAMTDVSEAEYLNLYNFDLPQHEDSPYIVTSPRSLRACYQQGIKPRELLYKSLDEYEEELAGLPLQDVIKVYEHGEQTRQEKLSMCRELRLKFVCPSARSRRCCPGRRPRPVRPGRPDLLPAALMSASSRSGSARSGLSRTKSVSWAGLDVGGDHYTDLPPANGVLSSEDAAEDWSSDSEASGIGREKPDSVETLSAVPEPEQPASGGCQSSQEDAEQRNGSAQNDDATDAEDVEDLSDGEEDVCEVEEDVSGAENDDGGEAGVDEGGAEGDNDDKEEGDNAVETEDGDVGNVEGERSVQELYEISVDGDDRDRSRSTKDHSVPVHEPEDVGDQESASEEEADGDRYRSELGGGAAPAPAGAEAETEDEDEDEDEDELEPEPGWYPMDEPRPVGGGQYRDGRLSPGIFGSIAGLSTASVSPEWRQSRAVGVTFSGRPPRGAPAPAERVVRPALAAAHTRASSAPPSRRRSTPATSVPSAGVTSGTDLNVRPSDRRILELMSRRLEQERLHEWAAEQERERWRQEWLQQLEQEAARSEQRAERVLAKRRVEAWESDQRRQELERRHCQSLDNLAALICSREERARLSRAEEHRRRELEMAERRRREHQLRLMTSEQREQQEAADREQRWQQQQRLQRRMDETERRRTDRELERRRHLSSMNSSWGALSEERIQRLDELSGRRSRLVWEELSRRIETAASNQRRLQQLRRAHARSRSVLESERRRQVLAARHQHEAASAGRSRDAAIRLQQNQQRAAQTSRQLAERRQQTLGRDNLDRQLRHRQALSHIRELEQHMVDEARFKLKLDEARVEQFLKQKQQAIMSSRRLAHLSANLRQTIRSGGRTSSFDKMAARADLEARVLSGPGLSCCLLYRPRSCTHLV